MLLFRDGHGGDPAAMHPGGVAAEAPPAAADLQHMVCRLQAQLAAQRLILLRLCLFQALTRAGEAGGGVGHGASSHRE